MEGFVLAHPLNLGQLCFIHPGNVLRVSSFENVSAFPVMSFLIARGAISFHGVASILPCSRLPTYSPNARRT